MLSNLGRTHNCTSTTKPYPFLNWTIALFTFLSTVLDVLTVLKRLCFFTNTFQISREFSSLKPPVLDIQNHECHYRKEGRLLSLLSVGLQLRCPHSKPGWLPPSAWSYSFRSLCSCLDKDLPSLLKPIILYQSLIDASHQSPDKPTRGETDDIPPNRHIQTRVTACLLFGQRTI